MKRLLIILALMFIASSVLFAPSGTGPAAIGPTVKFNDSLFRVYDNNDATKLVAFEVTALTTGTTRTIYIGDADGNTADWNTAYTSVSGLTTGSVLFGGTTGTISEDNTNLFWDDSNNRLGIGTNAPDSIFHIKANVSGIVGGSGHAAGQLIIQDPDDTVFGNAVITGYESDGAGNPDQQLWYLGSSSSSNSNIIFLNRRNSKLQLGTNDVAQLTILGDGKIGIGTSTPSNTLTISGDVDILHTSTVSDDHAFEIDINADGYGDVKAIDIDYITGDISAGEDEAVVLLNINEIDAIGGDVFGLEVLATDGSAGIYGMKVGALIGPVHQDSGTFANPIVGTDNTTDTNDPNIIDGNSSNITAIFENNSEYIIIGSATAFEEIEFIITTGSSGAGIKPTFGYSTAGAHQFTAFTPVDGTNGFRNTGVVAWDAGDLSNHAVNTNTNTFDIIITRTRNALSVTPVLGYAKVAATTEYIWDKDGDINIKDLTASGTITDGTASLVGGALTGLTNLQVDYININGDTITHSTGGADVFYINGEGEINLTATGDATLSGDGMYITGGYTSIASTTTAVAISGNTDVIITAVGDDILMAAADDVNITAGDDSTVIVGGDLQLTTAFGEIGINANVVSVTATGVVKLTSSNTVDVLPSTDTDDYIQFKTVGDVPEITTNGTCELKLSNTLGTPRSITVSEMEDAHDHISNNGSDHSYIDQSVVVAGTPQFSLLGIGAAAASTAGINLAKTPTASHTGVKSFLTCQPASAAQNFKALNFNVVLSTSTENINSIDGALGLISHPVGGGYEGTITNASCFRGSLNIGGSTPPADPTVVTNAYIFYGSALTESAFCTIGTAYGLYLPDIATSGTNYAIYTVGSDSNSYFEGDISADDVTDRTPGWEGTSKVALDSLLLVKSKDGKIDHSTLPDFAKRTVVEQRPTGEVTMLDGVEIPVTESVEIPARSLGAMITLLTEAVKELKAENETLKTRVEKLEGG